jgi:hypothetical protein
MNPSDPKKIKVVSQIFFSLFKLHMPIHISILYDLDIYLKSNSSFSQLTYIPTSWPDNIN